ncbi:MAG: cytoplasmic protein [Proteobacteria bacterium]|nr:MAG: cytoplasmic protein [Pseudomonadota bacterium]
MRSFTAFWLGSAVTAASFLLAVKAGVAQDPVKENPDYFKVLLENERVRVIDDLVPAGAKVATHSHSAYVVYPLSSYRMKFTFPDGTTRVVDVQQGTARYSNGIVHAEENIGTTDGHALLVELKQPQCGQQ